MKKLVLFLSVLSMMIAFSIIASAQVKERNVNLVVGESQAQINDNNVTMSAPAQVIEGRTLVPLRFISEAFGCDVNWNNDTKTAMVTLVNQTIEVPIGQKYAVINGDKSEVAVPAQLINGSTYVPIRFISENLGAKVDYEPATRAISITMQKYFSEELGFEIVVPVNWVVSEETAQGIVLAPNETCQSTITLTGSGGNVNTTSFNEFVQQAYVEQDDNKEASKFVNGPISGIVYKEDGVFNIHAYKLIDKSIYFCAFAITEEAYNDSIVGQCDIVMNSLKAFVVE
jgi:hypothetical protein